MPPTRWHKTKMTHPTIKHMSRVQLNSVLNKTDNDRMHDEVLIITKNSPARFYVL